MKFDKNKDGDFLKEIIKNLENMSRLIKSSSNLTDVENSIKAVRESIKSTKVEGETADLLVKLDGELSTWQSKLSVIIKEPVGKQGMAKHAHYWVEQLSKLKA